ncbi:MAG: 30S ribosomal protein S7 [Thermoplasmata archaeon]
MATAKKKTVKKKTVKKKTVKKGEKSKQTKAKTKEKKGKTKAKVTRKAKPEKEAPKGPGPILLFGLWDLSEIEFEDLGLARYMNLSPTFLPHTGGRWANKPFAKERVNLVERLTNNMMRTEDYTGKKSKTLRVVKAAFELIEQRTKKNPVQGLVRALENAAPREEITRLRFGGISVPRAVDIAPSRRLDLALRYICIGAVRATYKNPKPIHECLADEILMAANGDINAYAIGRKEEMERVAASAR